MKSMKLLPIGGLVLALFFSSGCLNDLDVVPPYGLNAEEVYGDPNNYINVLAKLYAGLSTTGNDGPAGQGDLAGIDEGYSSYIRCMWNLQVLTTDEAICAWEQDDGIPELNRMTTSSLNLWVQGMYYRIFFQIPLCNEFIRQADDERMAERGFTADQQERIRAMRDEARFLRALSYSHALDLFGNVPFVTEEDLPGAFQPDQITRPELFSYVEEELLAVEELLKDPGTSDYGRVDKGAVWMTLAKLYLNAEVYIGTDRYADAAAYAQKVIDGPWSLDAEYQWLFLADNHQSNEVIFPVTFDGLSSQSYGGTVYLTHAPIGGVMDAEDFGVNSGWAGLRSTPQLVQQFPDSINDTRYNFFKGDTVTENSRTYEESTTLTSITFDSVSVNGVVVPGESGYFPTYTVDASSGNVIFYNLTIFEPHSFSIDDVREFTQGYGVIKFKNVDRAGVAGSDPTGDFVDTDWPFYRLADAYLIYAECAVRGAAGADMGVAMGLVDQIRQRAYGAASPPAYTLDLDFILAERCREMYWELGRRTDLIRFGRFTSGYDWAYKGGSVEGGDIDDYRTLYPLPASDLASNPKLLQNPGY